jgi:DNA polymerase-4
VTARKLRARGIERLVDVRTADPTLLRDAVGSLADWLHQLANGVDDRPVVPHRDVKSSGSESTYPADLTELPAIREEIVDMAHRAAAWLTGRSLQARTVTIKVRYSDFTTVTRSHSAVPTDEASAIAARALQLLERTDAGTRPVRLLGVSVHNFGAEPDARRKTADDWLPFDP